MKLKITLTCILMMMFCCVAAQASQTHFSPDYGNSYKTLTYNGIGMGSALAMVLSWDRNRSVLWALLHGLFSWLYVLYFAVTRK
jgi:hypothetical protein